MDIEYYKKYEPLFGSWYITRELGQGSYGTVFEIERNELGLTYKAALKAITIPRSQNEYKAILSEGQSEADASAYFHGFVEELGKEIALMSKMKGQSNIVSYEDHLIIEHPDSIGWDILIRMELLTPLNDYLQEHTFSEQEVIKLGIDLCKALEICQKYKIIHRDIKPENIFIADTGNYKLGDFGAARIVERTTGASTKAGTPPYMAPEVYRGERYSSNVDIYSLGLVLFRLANRNRPPFYPPPPEPITFRQREEAFAKRMGGADIPNPIDAGPRLSEIICKACAYLPEKRYESPIDMRRQLEAIQLRSDNKPAWVSTESNPVFGSSDDEPFDVYLPIVDIQDNKSQNLTDVPLFDETEPFIDLAQLYYYRKGNEPRGEGTIACAYCGELNPATYSTCLYCGNNLWNDVDYLSDSNYSGGDEDFEGDEFMDDDFMDEKSSFKRLLEIRFVSFCAIMAIIMVGVIIVGYLLTLTY